MAAIDDCVGCAWTCETDSSLGGSTQEWELSDTPDDLTTALAEDEALTDPSQGVTVSYDTTLTGCIVGLWIWILSHLNQQNNTGGSVLPIRIRTIPITTPKRIRKKPTLQGGGG